VKTAGRSIFGPPLYLCDFRLTVVSEIHKPQGVVELAGIHCSLAPGAFDPQWLGGFLDKKGVCLAHCAGHGGKVRYDLGFTGLTVKTVRRTA